jgi:hypothetical protein
VHEPGFDPGGGREGLGYLIPGQDVVRGDVEGVADRSRVAEKRHEASREIRVVGQRPEGRAVAVHDDLLALPHPAQHGPATVERNGGLVVSV